MTARLFYIFLFIIPCIGRAQNTDINLVVSAGLTNYFGNQPRLGRSMYDVNKTLGVNVFLNKKKRVIIFNPGIGICYYHYTSKINSTSWAQVRQRMIYANMEMLMKITKKTYLRAGIFITKMMSSDLGLAYSFGFGYYYYSDGETYKGYLANDIQAGITVGFVAPFKIKSREYKFNINVQQSGTPIVSSDYYATDNYTGTKVRTFSTKKYPTRLLLGFEINLKKIKRPKKEEEV